MNSWPNVKKKDSFWILTKFPFQNSPYLPHLVKFYPSYGQLKVDLKKSKFVLIKLECINVLDIVACLKSSLRRKVIAPLNGKFDVDFKTGIDLLNWARNDEVISKKPNPKNPKSSNCHQWKKLLYFYQLSTVCNLGKTRPNGASKVSFR